MLTNNDMPLGLMANEANTQKPVCHLF